MLKEHFSSEAGFYFRKKWFYVMLLLFLGLGYFMSVMASLSFPGVYVNSPYVLTYFIGLVSLINIFYHHHFLSTNLIAGERCRL